jgi:hypothetical protein
MSAARIVNPHYPSAPLRMADGRLFTDYRPNCTPTETSRSQMQANGENSMALDRYMTVNRAGQMGVVDTMVPELYKQSYTWSSQFQGMSHPTGIGTGRIYLPGRAEELIHADPDIVAIATFPKMCGTFPSYVEGVGAAAGPVGIVQRNRYSAPHS